MQNKSSPNIIILTLQINLILTVLSKKLNLLTKQNMFILHIDKKNIDGDAKLIQTVLS